MDEQKIIEALDEAEEFDIEANYDYISETLDEQLDYFEQGANLTDNQFEEWVQELMVVCANCYKYGWKRGIDRVLKNTTKEIKGEK